jgi:pullulanase/glycogen debranching enzyme
VDGFRFDLMSFSFKDNLLAIKRPCTKLIPRSTCTVKVGTLAKWQTTLLG